MASVYGKDPSEEKKCRSGFSLARLIHSRVGRPNTCRLARYELEADSFIAAEEWFALPREPIPPPLPTGLTDPGLSEPSNSSPVKIPSPTVTAPVTVTMPTLEIVPQLAAIHWLALRPKPKPPTTSPAGPTLSVPQSLYMRRRSNCSLNCCNP